MTYIQIVNQVLRRLRQDEVSQIPINAYAMQIGDLVNTTKREVEDAWPWSHLRTELDVATVASTTTYTLTGWGQRSQIDAVFDLDGNSILRTMTYAQWRRMVDLGAISSGRSLYYRLQGYTGGDPVMEIYPTPTEVRTLRVYGFVSQADLSADDDDLIVPEYPVLLGAYARAVSERGEDAGASYDETMRDYQSALNDAISRDNQANSLGHGSDWTLE